MSFKRRYWGVTESSVRFSTTALHLFHVSKMSVQLTRRHMWYFCFLSDHSMHCHVSYYFSALRAMASVDVLCIIFVPVLVAVQARGWLGTPRNITQGISRGSVLSAPLFNLALLSLPESFLLPSVPTVHFPLDTDDIALWAVGSTTCSSAVFTALHCRIDRTGLCLNKIGHMLSLDRQSQFAICFLDACPPPGIHGSLKGSRFAVYAPTPTWRPAAERTLTLAKGFSVVCGTFANLPANIRDGQSCASTTVSWSLESHLHSLL